MKKTINYFIMAISAVAMLIFIGSCSKSNDTLPAIDGYASSDAIAPTNLVSYFPFDGNANDTKGGTTATTFGGLTFTTGLRGQAYTGAAGAYATLTPSAAFSNLPSYTISFWYKLSAQPEVSGGNGPQGLFFLSGTKQQKDTSFYYPANGTELIFEIDRPSKSQVGTDSLALHNGFTNLGTTVSGAWQGFTMTAWDTTNYKSWIHVVATYDGGSSTYVLYQDGIVIHNGSAFGNGTSTPNILYQGNTPPGSTTPQGSMSWANDPPKQITIGTWPAGVYGVSPSPGASGCFLGQMDEFRIYNTVLSASDVGALYQLGKAGR